jgi:hypothetical protein
MCNLWHYLQLVEGSQYLVEAEFECRHYDGTSNFQSTAISCNSSLECFDWQLITMGCGSQFQSYIVSSHFSIKMLFGSSLSPVVCMSAYVLSVLFVLLCIVVSYMTCLYELHGKCVIRDSNCLPFVVHPGFTSSYLRGPCCSPEIRHKHSYKQLGIKKNRTASLCWNGNWLYMTGTDCHSQSKHSRLLSPLTNMKHVNLQLIAVDWKFLVPP